MADFKSVLKLRRAADGSTRIQGEPPERHVFPASFLQRELGQLVEVMVRVRTDAVDVEYRMDEFETNDDGSPNLTGWVCTRADQANAPETEADRG
ncbi:hypothetical protein Val02_82030 [Virgisporangium aliadipatigenens]|uniref:Uncharacterized protein n=1 Tax=Virgisporangium aliadipatigenens TaxID=741659 RepID=A0A8J3YVA2_9ACTN|nr:hypothetical protein [Virgisporangium aliadipatigenens]GIJ51317.1 hypothetical protein Val02_82030 [Virgisporangium aliadipatigenens]